MYQHHSQHHSPCKRHSTGDSVLSVSPHKTINKQFMRYPCGSENVKSIWISKKASIRIWHTLEGAPPFTHFNGKQMCTRNIEIQELTARPADARPRHASLNFTTPRPDSGENWRAEHFALHCLSDSPSTAKSNPHRTIWRGEMPSPKISNEKICVTTPPLYFTPLKKISLFRQ